MHTRRSSSLQRLGQQRLQRRLPHSLIQSGAPTSRQAAWLQAAQRSRVATARRSGPPEGTCRPRRPADILFILRHVRERVGEHLGTSRGVGPAKLANERLELVLLQPRRQRRKRCVEWLGALNVAATKVIIQVLVDVKRPVIRRVGDFVQVLGGRQIVARGARVSCPRVPTRVPITGRQDEVVRACFADGGDGGLVVFQDERGGHVVRFVHEPENDICVVGEAPCEFAPKGGELLCCCGVGVGCVADYAACEGLRGRVIVAHVVVRVEDGVGAFGDCYVVYGLLVEVKVLVFVWLVLMLILLGVSVLLNKAQ